MPKEQGGYISYLLRLWKSNERGNTTWRASLESTAEGRRYNFAHVESLVTFLLERFGPLRTEREASEGERNSPSRC